MKADIVSRQQHRRRLWAVSVAAAAVAAIAAVPLLARFGTDGGDGDTAAVTADQEQLQDSTADEGGGRAEATTEAGEDSGDVGTLSENPEDAGGFVVVALGSFLDQDRLLQAVRQEQATVAPSQGPASTLLPAAEAATTLCPSPLAPTEEITGVYQAAVADAPVTVYVYRKGAAGQAVL